MGITIGIICVIAYVIVSCAWRAVQNKKKWNNGISPFTNKPWVHFDTDSQGGQGYRDDEYNVIWIV